MIIPDSSFGQQASRSQEKSPVFASALALTATSGMVAAGIITESTPAGLTLGAMGIIMGPVFGYAYMNEAGLGLKYAATRALILGGSAAGSYLFCYASDCSEGFWGDNNLGIAMSILLIGVTAATLQNIIDTFSINRRVEDHRWGFALSPTYFPETKTPGLSAHRHF